MTLRGLIALLLCATTTNACTLVGMGIGASMDAMPGPYDARPATAHVSLAPKQRIVLWLANGRRIEGRYVGALSPTERDPETYLIIDSGDQAELHAASKIKALGVEQPSKDWLYGGLIGLAVDVTLVVMASIALSDMNLRGMHLAGGSGCFC